MTVDEYIAGFPEDTQAALQQVRQIVLDAAPSAEEGIGYGMLGYKVGGKPLVYLGGYKGHIGFYASPNGHEAFKEALASYKQGKGSVQFPLDKPIPTDLVRRMVEFRVAVNLSAGKTSKRVKEP
jgi:uncharacterized protein YdhG (YjbR/CyaY superfamily)